ncbi:MAG TPA: sensor histidine kinase [Candidatus Dormibacteraeota bacterium]|nr:sensor histidine kinase [Candidatus Dormibacteraeota bacterium]
MESRPRLWAWTGRLPPRTADLLIVGVLTFLGLISVAVDAFNGRFSMPQPWAGVVAVGLLLLQTVPLYWRRRAPNTVLVLVAAAFAFKYLIGINPGFAGAGLLIAMYSVAVYGSGRLRLWAVLVAGLLFVAGFLIFAVTGNPRWIALSGPAAVHVAAWLIGDYLRARRGYIAALEERAIRLERERRLDRELAADQERARIARELHDVVAHDVSVIAIQAGAARTVQQAHPEAATEILKLIETTARKTLVELSQLLGVLRKPGGGVPERGPQPGLDQLPGIVGELRAAGLTVVAAVEGEAQALPPALDLSAYRIIQESTTNILKHARAKHVEILVRYQPTELDLRVRDDGLGANAANGVRSGHGLVGMRERVTLFGGELQAGPLKGGGFEVSARLPIGPSSW